MARLVSNGFETGFISATDLDTAELIYIGAGTVTVQQGTVRSGGWAAKCDSAVGNAAAYLGSSTLTNVANTTYYIRAYFCFSALPASAIKIINVGSAAVGLTSGGKIQLNDNNGVVAPDSAATIVADGTTWYRIELSWTQDASFFVTACEARLNGVSVATSTLAPGVGTTFPTYGWATAPGASKVLYIDDIAVNDSSGANQATWPGSGKVVLLIPTGDSAVGTGWTLGTGTAISGGSGATAVKNTPPKGVADTAAGSDVEQIRNASSNASVSYDANLTTYTAAGVGAADTLNVVQPIVATAAPVTTSAKQGLVGLASNPAITTVALSSGRGTAGAFWAGAAAGTFATGWKWSLGTTTYVPSVTLGTAPVARITQVTSSTRIAIVCFLGAYVDYTPAVVAALPPKRVALQAVNRASTY